MTAPRISNQWRRAGHTFGHQMSIVRRGTRYYLKRGRVIAWLRFLWLQGVLQYGCEDCEVCGRSYVLWAAPDEIWDAVVGSVYGTYCPNCFDLKAQDVGHPRLCWSPRISTETVISDIGAFSDYNDIRMARILERRGNGA